MIHPLPEHTPRPLTLEHFVLEETAESEIYLSSIAVHEFLDDRETTQAEANLNKCIGEFVIKQLTEKEDTTSAEITHEIEEAAQPWLREQLYKRILNARYEAYFEHKQSQVETLLQGKTLTAQSLNGLGYALADGREMVVGPDSPKEVSGTVIGYDPSASKFWIETHPELPEFVYEVAIWDYDPYSKQLVQASEIKIV